MKKKHKLIAGAVAIVVFIGFLVVHFAGNMAAGYVDKLADEQTVLKGKLQIGHFSADVSGNVVFKDITWLDTQGKLVAKMPTMNVSANLFDVISGNFGVKSINTISMEKPEFNVQYTDKEGLNIVNLINFPKDDGKPTAFRGIVEIENGKLGLLMNGKELHFDGVQMQANIKEYPKMVFMLQGKNGEGNLIGTITKTYNNSVITGEAKKYALTELMKVLPSFGDVEVLGGSIADAKLKAENKDERWTVNINGSVDNVAAKVLGYGISDGRGEFAIDNKEAVFKKTEALVEGQKVTGEGKIVFHEQAVMPTYDLTFNASAFEIDAVSPGLGVDDPLNISGKVTGPIDKPLVAGDFSMAQLKLDPLLMTNVNGQYNFAGGIITLLSSSADAYNGKLAVTGTVEAATKNFLLHYVGRGLDSAAVTETSIDGPLDFEGDASGTGSAESAIAAGAFAINKGNYHGLPFDVLTGDFSRAKGVMSFSNIVVVTPLGRFASSAVMSDNGKVSFGEMGKALQGASVQDVTENVKVKVKDSVQKGLGKLFKR